MLRTIADIRNSSNSGFIHESIQEIERRAIGRREVSQSMRDSRVLDYLSELRIEQAYLTGFVESLVQDQPIGTAEALLNDLAYNLQTVSASDIPIQGAQAYMDVVEIPKNIELFRANHDAKKQYATEYISNWIMYNDLFGGQ